MKREPSIAEGVELRMRAALRERLARRDIFAAAALQGLMAGRFVGSHEKVARAAWDAADAMLKMECQNSEAADAADAALAKSAAKAAAK